MKQHRILQLALAVSLVLVAASPGRAAGIDVPVGNGDAITGTLSPATEVESFRVRVPRGATISVKAKAAKQGPALRVRVLDSVPAQIGDGSGKSVSVTTAAVAASGEYVVQVSSQDGTTTGEYALSVSWRSPTSFSVTTDLAPAAAGMLAFAADAGATATVSSKPAKGSVAKPSLTGLATPDLPAVVGPGAVAKVLLASAGEYALTFSNSGAAAGAVTATVKIKPPKSAKRKIALTAKVIGSGDAKGDAAIAEFVGSAGGTVTVPVIPPDQPGTQISGTSVTIPGGSLTALATVVIATAPPITALGALNGAGPTVFFGPEGTRFDLADKSATAHVTLPYDPAFDAATDAFVVYTRDAKGKVTVVPPPYTVNHIARTVSFATSHFSSFRVAGDAPPSMSTVATNLFCPLDICVAHEPSGQSRYSFFVADDDTPAVQGLVPQGAASSLFNIETFAGGGALSADGTPRLQYSFQSVTAVSAAPDGTVYAGSSKRIYRVTPDGKVAVYAGTGVNGNTGDGGPAVSATFRGITSVLADAQGRLYVCDGAAHRIRLIDAAGQIQAWAGTGATAVGADGIAPGATTFFSPSHLAFAHDGSLYVTDAARLRKLNTVGPVNVTVAGSAAGVSGSTGDDGPLLAARFRNLSGVSSFYDTVRQKEIVAVTDITDHTARLLDLGDDRVTLLAGQHGVPGDAADAGSVPPGRLSSPTGVIVRSTNEIFVLDYFNSKVRRIAR